MLSFIARIGPVLAFLVLVAGTASAADSLVVGRASATALTFIPLELGERAGIWKRNGIDLKIVSFGGDAQLQQALTAGTVSIGLGSGPGLAFVAKGVPVRSIGAFAGRPYDMCLVVSPQSGVKSVQDLKGKKIGVTTLGSLTHWMVLETSRRMGWKGADAIVAVPLGATRTRLAAMSRGQIAGHVTTSVQAFEHEADGSGRLVLNFGDVVENFITHVIFARNDFIAEHPDVARRFLAGWWQTIDYMRAHKDETVAAGSTMLGIKPEIVAKSYPYVMATLTRDGQFDGRALAVLAHSFVDLGILPKEPDMSKLYTTQFLPAR